VAVNTWCTNVSGVVLRRVGEIKLGDLEMIGRLQGQEGLPYPFGHSHPHKQHDERISSVADRLDHGDLSAFLEWTDAYVAADIWVACRVHHRSAGTPDRRILAYRAGESGYLACQRSHDDIVEVSRLSALDLGAAIAASAGLTEPGTQPRIVIPGYVGQFAERAPTEYDDDDEVYSVRVEIHRSSQPTHSVLADEDVTAIATIQSRWQPPRRWGVDWTKNVIVYIQMDGDYIYTPDFSHAVPLTEHFLGERIDRLIADDISALQLHRRIEA
jgi:ESAT-6 protein secretion system EspG family protein